MRKMCEDGPVVCGQPGQGVSDFRCRGMELAQWLRALAVLAEG